MIYLAGDVFDSGDMVVVMIYLGVTCSRVVILSYRLFILPGDESESSQSLSSLSLWSSSSLSSVAVRGRLSMGSYVIVITLSSSTRKVEGKRRY